MDSLIKFYDDNYINELLDIINTNNNISLRIIDWFVTNYSKKYDIHIVGETSHFIVHKDYKDQLKAFTKKQFDPFCRRERIIFYYDDVNSVETTVGQLNFFRWAIENKIIMYIRENYDDIERDMISNTKNQKKQKKKEICVKANKSINKFDVEIVLEFD